MRTTVYVSSEMPSRFRLPKFTCLRCGHEWHPRRPERPKRCARCKDANWDKPRQWERKEPKEEQAPE